jgi:16S rRNA (guanine527-N7)-methyltransferase
MEKGRIAELLRPFLTLALSDQQLNLISMYIDILLKWNQRINLTAVRTPEEIMTRHFGESLFAAQQLFPSSRASAQRDVASNVSTMVDVGSGAGFPGLPVKIWAPEIRLTLIESNQKKATFLREVVRMLGLEGVDVFAGRAERFPAASADVVTLRAVERFEKALSIAAALVRPGGRLAALIGKSQIEEAKTVVEDVQWQTPVSIPLSNSRVLLAGST